MIKIISTGNWKTAISMYVISSTSISVCLWSSHTHTCTGTCTGSLSDALGFGRGRFSGQFCNLMQVPNGLLHGAKIWQRGKTDHDGMKNKRTKEKHILIRVLRVLFIAQFITHWALQSLAWCIVPKVTSFVCKQLDRIAHFYCFFFFNNVVYWFRL